VEQIREEQIEKRQVRAGTAKGETKRGLPKGREKEKFPEPKGTKKSGRGWGGGGLMKRVPRSVTNLQ